MALSGYIVVARRRSTDRKGLVVIVPNLVQKAAHMMDMPQLIMNMDLVQKQL